MSSPGQVTITGFWHGGVTVSDMDAARAFYEGLLGLEPISDRVTHQAELLEVTATSTGTIRICMLKVPNHDVYVELLQYSHRAVVETSSFPASRPGTGHLCFYVDDLRGMWQRLSAAGVASLSEGPVDCSGRIPGTWCIYLRDPDGYLVELFEGPRYPDRTPIAVAR